MKIHTILFFSIYFLVQINRSWAQQDQPRSLEEDTRIIEDPTTDQKLNTQAPWPIPFKPSQKIGADSQISFPTDI